MYKPKNQRIYGKLQKSKHDKQKSYKTNHAPQKIQTKHVNVCEALLPLTFNDETDRLLFIAQRRYHELIYKAEATNKTKHR